MVDAVAPRDGAEPRQIEVRVLDFQRIEGPFQQVKAGLERVIALGQLQAAAEAIISPRLAHRQHVRVQIRMAGARAGNGESKADQLAAIKGADDLPADFPADHEHAQRDQVHVVKIPDLFLQRDAGLELFHAVALANRNLSDSWHRGAHLAGLLQGSIAESASKLAHYSRLLACCHKASISSSVASCNVRPCLRNCSSTQPKRRRNFLLVRRNADSESTERYRAMLTSTKKRSPISSSTFSLS